MRTRSARLLTLAATLIATAARAQPAPVAGDEAAAEALFEEGRQLAKAKRWPDACPKFEASYRLSSTLGTLLNLADCLENEGRTASAWARFREASALAQRAHRRDAETTARERAAALEPSLPHVTIVVESAGPEVTVTRDGVALDRAALGTPIPVDPGPHTIAASAPSKSAWSTSIDVAASEASVVRVPALVGAASPAPGEQPAGAGHVHDEGAPTDSTKRTGGIGTQRVAALATGGVALVAIGVGTFFGLSARAKLADALDSPHCSNDVCDQVGGAAVNDAKSNGNVSTAAFIVAGVATAGAVVLWLTAPSPRGAVGVSFRRATLGLDATF